MNSGILTRTQFCRQIFTHLYCTNMSSDTFQEISEENIPNMLEVFQQNWPKHFTMFQMVTVMREFKKAGSPWKQTIYLHGDYETGVYLHKVTGQVLNREWMMLYLYTPKSTTPVKECLEKTKVIPWEEGGFYFNMSDSRFRHEIEAVCVSKNTNCTIHPNTLFWYPPEKELHPKNIPDDLSLEFLDESYADEMNRNWPHKSQGSELILAENIRRNFALGLLKKTDKKLLCSALSTFTGGIFVLYTDPEYRGRGYAGLMLEQMALEIRKRKRIPFATVIIGNKASESTFTRTGFERWSNVDYTHINKTN